MRLSDEHADAIGIGYAVCSRCGHYHGWLKSDSRPPCPRCGIGWEAVAKDKAVKPKPEKSRWLRSWTVRIDGWHPATVNQLLAGRWRAHALKKRDKETIAHWLEGIPKATGKRRLTLTITLAPGRRAADPDGYWKSLCDALTWHGWLRDDNRQSVELPPVEFERGTSKATTLKIEEIA